MSIKKKTKKLIKNFGFVYFIGNIVILAVMVMFAINAWMSTGMSPGYLVSVLPLTGIFAGYWLRKSQFGWWRCLIIVINLILTASILFSAVFIAPQLEKTKQIKYESLQKSLSHDSPVKEIKE